MAFLIDKATQISLNFLMQLDELRSIVRTLPIGAADQCRDVVTLSAALASYCGKLSALVGKTSGPEEEIKILTNCGAAILALAAIAEGQGFTLDAAVRAGQKELARSE